MATKKSYEEINEKIRRGQAVVVTAEEIIGIVEEKGYSRAAQEVDVVTTGTFGPMCSSGVFLNFGHSNPRIRMTRTLLNNVEAYSGIAAVDAYLGATALPLNDPENKVFPGKFIYGGGHVIHDLVARKPVHLEAYSYGTDCYPRKHISTYITLDDINNAMLFNPRNAYQNYPASVNLSDKTIYTYKGILKPRMGNASYSTSGPLSPLLNDPNYKTIGVGTRIFLGGGIGYVAWPGTQHSPNVERTEKGVPKDGAGTLAVIGDLKQMHPQWLVGASLLGYGVSLYVGIGIPIPILDEEILINAAVRDEEIYCPVIDYSDAYPNRQPDNLGYVSFKELQSGKVIIEGKEVPSTPMTSYPLSRKIAELLKEWIINGKFELTCPVASLPRAGDDVEIKSLPERSFDECSFNR